MVITLVEKEAAEPDYTFTHLGASKICDQCPLKKVCVDVLKENHSYKVTEVRKKEHICLIENQPMLVCVVEEADYTISVTHQKYLENILLKRNPLKCKEILCENYDFCMPPIFDVTSKVKVQDILRELTCPLDFKLVLIKAKKVEKE
ncbi:MAG: UPF0179 family protein [Candidatus Heimdallarchaeota archaeon]|nr:UPF0179 family protein [Candidatus Heimdallarchaeota archaeon]